MTTIDELEQRVRLLELASHRFDRIDAVLQQQDVGSLRNTVTGLRADMDAKFDAVAGQLETIITLLRDRS